MGEEVASVEDKSAYEPLHDKNTGRSGNFRPAKEIIIQAEKEIANDESSPSEVNYVGDYIDPMSPEAYGEGSAAIYIGEYLDPKDPLARSLGSVEFITIGDYVDPDVGAMPVQIDVTEESVGEYLPISTSPPSSSDNVDPVYLGDYIEPGPF